jgi:hypothetical protein
MLLEGSKEGRKPTVRRRPLCSERRGIVLGSAHGRRRPAAALPARPDGGDERQGHTVLRRLSGNIVDRSALCFDSAHFVQKDKVEARRRAAS